jgi:hypothetical protein
MLHLWLIPALVILLAAVCGFYLLIRRQAGAGTRTEGRTILEKPEEEPPPDDGKTEP